MMTAPLAACSPADPPRRTISGTLVAPADRLSLQITLPRQTISYRDEKPVEVLYFVVNGAEPVRFDNRPEHWSVRLETDSGKVQPPTFVTSPATGAVGAWVDLPARGILGQVMNLRCLRDSGGYGGDPLVKEECLGFYPLDQLGTYRVIVTYDGPDFRRPPLPADSIAADTSTAPRPRPAARLRMADTAELVITG